MKLQVAFDDITGKRSLEILKGCHEQIDIIEAGTLLIIKEGLSPLIEMRKQFPDATILADPKIMDAPEKIARSCFEAGADIVTVMSVAGEKVISKVVETAKAYKGKVFVDLLGCSDVKKAAKEADSLGADLICIHTSTESKVRDCNLLEIKAVLTHSMLAAAGGIKAETLERYKDADVIIVGSGVYAAEDPIEAVKTLKEKIDELS
jgi:3-hexulose-6-phosphate synthase